MALTRFEARREAVVNEANAIGTTALRARLLAEPHRTESLKLLQEYARIRVENVRTGLSLAELPKVIARFERNSGGALAACESVSSKRHRFDTSRAIHTVA